MPESAAQNIATGFLKLIELTSAFVATDSGELLARFREMLPPTVKPRGILKLGLVSDSLRVICLASGGRCVVSSGVLCGTEAWVKRCARLLSESGRPLYADFGSLSGMEVDHFLRQFYRDTELFGGNCTKTEWAGYSMIRTAAQRSKNIELLGAYEAFLFGWMENVEVTTPDSAFWTIRQLVADAKGLYGGGERPVEKRGAKVTQQPRPEIAVTSACTDRSFQFQISPLVGPALFEVREKNESLAIVINEHHPLAESLKSLIGNNGHSHQGIQQLFHAWARLENGSGEVRRRLLEDIRYDWGRIAREVSDETSL